MNNSKILQEGLEHFSVAQCESYFHMKNSVHAALKHGKVCTRDMVCDLEQYLQTVRDEEAHLIVLKFYRTRGEAAELLDFCRQYVQRFAHSLDAQQAFLHALHKNAQHDLALNYFEQNLVGFRLGPCALKIAASSARAVGKAALAKKLYLEVLAVCEWDCEAELGLYSIYIEELQATGHSALLDIEKAHVELLRGFKDEALQFLLRARANFSSRVVPEHEKDLQKFLSVMHQVQAYTMLIEFVQPMVAEGLRSPDVLFYLAEAYRMQNKPTKALEVMDCCEAQQGAQSCFVWSRSAVLEELKRYDACIEACLQALEVNSQEWTILHRLGVCHQANKEMHKALDYYQRALEANPAALPCYTAVLDVSLALGQLDLFRKTFSVLIECNLAPDAVLDYWREQVSIENELDSKAVA